MENIVKLVVFQLKDQRFALHLPDTERIVQVVEIIPLPKMPDYIYGIINMKGEVIPVINIRILFNMPSKEIELSDQLIIVNTTARKLALLVDSTRELIECKENEIIKSDKIINGIPYINGVIKLEDGMVLINDINKFLDPEELKLLEAELAKIKS